MMTLSLLKDLRLDKVCAKNLHMHLPGPLRKIIQSYVCKELTDDTIIDAVEMWCKGIEGKRDLNALRSMTT